MSKTKKINRCLYLLLTVFCLLFLTPAQSQNPAVEITLTWSTDTYVPPSYPGKALPVRGSIVEVVASVDSPAVNPQELDYQWFLDDDLQKRDSGQGKQIFKFNTGDKVTHQYSIRIEVKDTQGTLLSSSYLSLKPVEPEIILETKIPVSESTNLTKQYQIPANQEVKFTAQPYFFNIREISDLNYNWNLDKKEASQVSNDYPNVLTLEIGQIGRSIERDLGVGAEDKNNPLQRAQAKARIILVP